MKTYTVLKKCLDKKGREIFFPISTHRTLKEADSEIREKGLNDDNAELILNLDNKYGKRSKINLCLKKKYIGE